MSFFSILGSVIYYKQSNHVWLIASVLMIVVFIISLCLPKDNGQINQAACSLSQTMKEIFSYFIGESHVGKRLLYTNLTLALIFQILTQYWQYFIYHQHMPANREYIFGFAFFLILLSQSAAGFFIEKVKHQRVVFTTISSCGMISVLSLCFVNQYWYSLIGSLCLILFCASSIANISLSKIVENCPKEMRSTLLSSSSVFSKILMFGLMPISAYLIKMIGIGYLWLIYSLILVISLLSKFFIYYPCSKTGCTSKKQA